MNAIEIVSIGDEVLSGSIVNTNAAFISQSLCRNGYFPSRHSVFPDAIIPLLSGLQEAISRSACVICTGGLGPTCDDNTRQAAARLFDSDWVLNEEVAHSLRQRYGERLISLNDQATVPKKALIVPNHIGTAPGLIFVGSSGTLVLLPGVPNEMREMFTQSILPYLKQAFPVPIPTIQKRINLFNVTESAIDPLLREIGLAYPSLKIGIYAHEGILEVLFSSEVSEKEALDSAHAKVIQKHKDQVFESATGKIEEALQTFFIQNKLTLSTAESCTGGSMAAKITKLPGASRYFLGGTVVYSNEMKHKLLGVSLDLLREHGPVSLPIVEQMAIGMQHTADSDYAVAVSGIAGPEGGTEKIPVGTICAAISSKERGCHAWRFNVYGNREMIIAKSVNIILAELLKFVLKLYNRTG
jgi:nicotinamide-nucleotide amidase